MSNYQRWLAVLAVCSVLMTLGIVPVLAQTTISTGSIVGTVTDPSGAVVSGAKVMITNKATGQVITTTTTSTGNYASGALIPGDYTVRVEASGFKTTQMLVVVQVNTTASGNLKLTLGESAQVVEVQASELAVNTEQATVQGVITAQQIENLPINGRNFLDLAQLDSLPCPSAAASAGPHASRSTVLTSATRTLAPQPKTFQLVRSRSPRYSSLRSTSQLS
jgi:hypothetical protein